MHYVQRHILDILSFQMYARFRDMRPPRIDTNLYSYHLKVLQKEGFVQKTEKGYTLSAKGLSYVDGLSLAVRGPRKQPKSIVIFALYNKRNEWLIVQRLMQPYIGQYMLPSGKQHYGESPEMHVKRELVEQLGGQPDVTLRGFTDVRIHLGDEVVTHVRGQVYAGQFEGPVPTDSKKFSYLFMDKNHPDMVPATTEIIEAIETGEGLFYNSYDAQAGS